MLAFTSHTMVFKRRQPSKPAEAVLTRPNVHVVYGDNEAIFLCFKLPTPVSCIPAFPDRQTYVCDRILDLLLASFLFEVCPSGFFLLPTATNSKQIGYTCSLFTVSNREETSPLAFLPATLGLTDKSKDISQHNCPLLCN